MDEWQDGFTSEIGYNEGNGDTEGWFGQGQPGNGIIILPNGDEERREETGTNWASETVYPEEEKKSIQSLESYDDILGIRKEADTSMLSQIESVEAAEEGAVLGVDNQQEKEIVYRILGTSGGESNIYSIDDVYPILVDIRTELRNLNRHQTNMETFGFVTVALLSMVMGGLVTYGFFRRII